MSRILIRLCDIFPLGRNKKLYYVYDFGSSWCFEVVKKGRETAALVASLSSLKTGCRRLKRKPVYSEFGTPPT